MSSHLMLARCRVRGEPQRELAYVHRYDARDQQGSADSLNGWEGFAEEGVTNLFWAGLQSDGSGAVSIRANLNEEKGWVIEFNSDHDASPKTLNCFIRAFVNALEPSSLEVVRAESLPSIINCFSDGSHHEFLETVQSKAEE